MCAEYAKTSKICKIKFHIFIVTAMKWICTSLSMLGSAEYMQRH